jgi:hypothetical protein
MGWPNHPVFKNINIILFYIYFKILNNILLFYIEWDTWADLWLLDENEWPRFQKKKKKSTGNSPTITEDLNL